MPIENIRDLASKFTEHAKASDLVVQCVNSGSFQSEIAVISEAPGDHEVSKGLPLVGASGTLLWNVLGKFNIRRNDVYVTNVCKRQVALGNDKRNPINKHELQLWQELLLWELSQLPKLKYVVLLGNYALEAVTGNTGVMNWRGSVLATNVADRPVRAIISLNPAMLIREPKYEVTFRYDMKKVSLVTQDQWKIIPVSTHINPTYKEAAQYLEHVTNNDKDVAYDIEVIANETACIGFADGPNEAMCINFHNPDKEGKSHFLLWEEKAIRKRCAKLFRAKENKLIAQNNMFDASWLLYKDRIYVPQIKLDTMLGHHILYPPLPHNLGYITTQYTTRPYYKDEKDGWKDKGDIDAFWRYNGQDAANTHAAAFAINSELKQAGLDKFFYEHVMRAQPELVRMVVGGVKVDEEKRAILKQTIGDEVEKRLAEFYEAVHLATGDDTYEPNPRSPKQLTELLFSKLKLVGRGVSTNAENRNRMFSHPATTEPKRRVLSAIDNYAQEQKFFSTYVNTAIDDDGRMRCTYNQTGVQSAPGRLSSSGMLWKNKAGDQTGMNLQNQPERAYEMYIADEGYGLCYFDLAQAEARLVAYFANIPKWKEQFERARLDGSYDAHRALASDMFKIPYDDVPTFDRYDISKGYMPPEGKVDRDVTVRFISKRCRHGLNYRMQADRLATVTGLPLSEAYKAYKIYHSITPELQRWWASLEQEARTSKVLYNAYGRRLPIMQRLSPEALESIVAFKPQSTLGDKVVQVIYQCHSDLQWPIGARMALNIHDALIALAPLDQRMKCLQIMKKYAESPIRIGMEELIIPADTKLSVADETGKHRWSTLKAVEKARWDALETTHVEI